MSRTIPLTRGYVAIVDEEDYEWIAKYKWHTCGSNYHYAGRCNSTSKTPWTILMHREILALINAPSSVYADHINGNTLDNRRFNLRITDNKGNQGNRKFNGGSSKYRGVYWCKHSGKWRARIKRNRKLFSLGHFVNEQEAARTYDAAAKEHFGEFAKLNFPNRTKELRR